MEQLTNKLNPNKKPQEQKYLQPKSLIQNSQQPMTDINNDIDRILSTAEQFLQDPHKSTVDPKRPQQQEDADAPKRMKPMLQPYKPNKKPILSRKTSQSKKINAAKYPQQKRSGSLIKQEVTQKITQVVSREPIRSFKESSSRIAPPKVYQSPSKQVSISLTNDKSTLILIEDQSPQHQPKNTQYQPAKPQQQPYLQLQPIQQQPPIQQPPQQQNVQPALLKKLEFTGFKELSKLKKTKEAVFGEYLSSYSYFREKEQKSRSRFLTKYHQHMNERRKILQQESVDKQQTFFSLKNEIDTNHLTFIEQQLTIAQPKQLLHYKYVQQVQQYIDAIEFDDNLLNTLRRANPQNITKLKLEDLLEVFRLWSQIQIIRQNYQQLFQQLDPQPEQSQKLVQWLSLTIKGGKQQHKKVTQNISTSIIKTNQYANLQEIAQDINRSIVMEQIYTFIWKTLQTLVFNKQSLEQQMLLFKTLMNVLTRGTSVYYVFRKSDLVC